MPKKSTSTCACSRLTELVLDLPKTRNGVTDVSPRNLTILIPKSAKSSKADGKSSKAQAREERRSNSGSSSSIAEYAGQPKNVNKHRKRLNTSRRTRSAERSESHYTYIDSGSSIISGGIREDTIPEALYCTIDEPPLQTPTHSNSTTQMDMSNRPQPVYAVPSMTSPPPTYDVAIAKSWQSGLPPSYEEYLCHKYAMLARSHTPPPPWSDSTSNIQQARRELLASQPELREYVVRQGVAQSNSDLLSYHYQVPRDAGNLHNQQALRKQANLRSHRARAMPPRSHSESRVQNQRVATMYEDAAFCMETTAIQSAFEHGVAFCSIM